MQRAFRAGSLLRVILHARSCNVPSKLDAQYSGFFEVVETRGMLLPLRKLGTQRIFTANHDEMRLSTIARLAAQLVFAARTAEIPPGLRVVLQFQVPRVASSQPAPHAVFKVQIFPIAPPQSASQLNSQNLVSAAPRPRVRVIPNLHICRRV